MSSYLAMSEIASGIAKIISFGPKGGWRMAKIDNVEMLSYMINSHIHMATNTIQFRLEQEYSNAAR